MKDYRKLNILVEARRIVKRFICLLKGCRPTSATTSLIKFGGLLFQSLSLSQKGEAATQTDFTRFLWYA